MAPLRPRPSSMLLHRPVSVVLLPLALGGCWENPAGPKVPAGRLVYRTTQGGVSGIVVSTTDGLERTQLSAAGEDRPAWSPDGSMIAFERPNANGHSDIWVYRADGVAAALTRTPARNERDPSWSPDGTRVAYAATFSAAGGGTSDSIMVESIAAAGAAAWTSGSDPSWGPDGRIAFVDRAEETGGPPAIWLLGMQGDRARASAAASEPVMEQEPAWSPTGQLAWTRRRQVSRPDGSRREEWSIMVQQATGGAALALLTDTVPLRAPAWSPEGTHLAITAGWTGTPQVWIVSGTDGSRRRVSSTKCAAAPCANEHASWTRAAR